MSTKRGFYQLTCTLLRCWWLRSMATARSFAVKLVAVIIWSVSSILVMTLAVSSLKAPFCFLIVRDQTRFLWRSTVKSSCIPRTTLTLAIKRLSKRVFLVMFFVLSSRERRWYYCTVRASQFCSCKMSTWWWSVSILSVEVHWAA